MGGGGGREGGGGGEEGVSGGGGDRFSLLRPHRPLRCRHRITLADSREFEKRNCKLPAPRTRKPCNLKSAKLPKNEISRPEQLRNCSRPMIEAMRSCRNSSPRSLAPATPSLAATLTRDR